MPITLSQAFIAPSLRMLGALEGMIDKAQAHVASGACRDADLIEARLADDMWPLPWHVRSCWVHSAYTLEQLPTGEFTPDFTDIPDSWDAMRAMVADARGRLETATPERVEALADETVHFVLGGKRLMEFSGQDFLLGFNLPNVYFHGTTFYDILRMKGVSLAKRDFLGQMPMR